MNLTSDLKNLSRQREEASYRMPWNRVEGSPREYERGERVDRGGGRERVERVGQERMERGGEGVVERGQGGQRGLRFERVDYDYTYAPREREELPAQSFEMRGEWAGEGLEGSTEYSKMKAKYYREINKQRNRVNQSMAKSNQNGVEEQRQRILNNIRNLKYGEYATRESPDGSPESYKEEDEYGYGYADQVRKGSYFSKSNKPQYKSSSQKIYRPRIIKRDPDYVFNTKTMSDKEKMKEYQERRKERKGHDKMKKLPPSIFKKETDTSGKAANVVSFSKTSGKTSETKKALMEKIRDVDREAEYVSDRNKTDGDPKTLEEEPYLESIRMKMKVIDNMMKD